ncbi:uncharacterized protein PHACADRAFT_258859 [Phanerochaete carnosa HHB-10118-sp]|uniref:PWWP domain-containing protein n=1 Tax=Phanerochaete carnosa (strain HHB-10118-sp) TaxID=650164 RepID=K5WWD4_PHACS|nr:uncharacterized protein PHACADRAFT_258859 [Phanerochaete carnosa HHB-10118-sp]EKM54777.1 hypothetical protein PHACADRAFT_258859 [Phanerochaete carnosa HHB-10118-sp]
MSKKGAKSQPKETSYEVRDVVLAKVRGYPPWPGIIIDPESVPKNVAKERPNAKSKKGNWYCVRFFPAGDYAWVVPKDISKLQQHEIQAYIDEPYKKSGDLLQGYKIALDPKKWEEEREALQAEAAEEEANAEVDQLEESEADEGAEDEDDEKKPKTKKRKRESEVASAKNKSVKVKAKKEPAESKKKASTASKSKKNGVKSKAVVESEDEGADGEEDEDAGPSKKTSPPPAKKQKRDKDDEDVDSALAKDPEAVKVRDWRHKLQKAFLSKSAPKEEDMPGFDQLFRTVEEYDNMSIQYLTFSKIGKVMRHIHALSTDKVPRDDEFKFRERAKTLVDKWHDILSASKASEGAVRKPATNGKPHTEEAGTANGKEDANGKEEKEATSATEEKDEAKDSMEIDAREEAAPETASEKAEEKDNDAPAEEEATPAAAEFVADIAMSEAA